MVCWFVCFLSLVSVCSWPLEYNLPWEEWPQMARTVPSSFPSPPLPIPSLSICVLPFSSLPSPSSSSTDWLWSVSRGTRVVSSAGIRLKGATLLCAHPIPPLCIPPLWKAPRGPPTDPHRCHSWKCPFLSLSLVLSSVMGDERLIGLAPTVLKISSYARHSVQRIHLRWAAPYQAGWEAGWPIRAWNGARGHITAPFHIMGCGGLLMRPGSGLLLICPFSYWRGSQPVELYEILSNSQ